MAIARGRLTGLVAALMVLLGPIPHAYADRFATVQRTTRDGLAQSQVMALLQDSRGFLWIGTRAGGVDRFDGQEYLHYTVRKGLPSNVIITLAEHNGQIFAGTRLGLARYDEAGDEFKAVELPEPYQRQQVNNLATRQGGALLVGSWTGLVVIEADKPRAIPLLEGQPVAAVTYDPRGHVWVVTHTSVFYGPDVDHLEEWKPVEPLPRFRTLVTDDANAAWLATAGGLFRVQGGQFEAVTLPPEVTDPSVRELLREDDGTLWVGVEHGLVRIKGTSSQFWGEEQGLSGERVTAILRDREGTLHIGTNGAGLVSLPPVPFFSFTLKGLPVYAPTRPVWTRDEDTFTLYIPTLGQGLIRVKNGQERQFTSLDGLSSTDVPVVLIDSHTRVWVGTGSGLMSLEGDHLVSVHPGMGTVLSAVEDRQGQVWFATDDGLWRWKEGVIDHFGKDQGFPAKEVLDMVVAQDGTLWTSSPGDGVVQWDPSTLKVLQHLNSQRVLPSDVVQCLFQSRDGVWWFGTDRGLVKWDGHHTELIGAAEGLPDGDIYFLQEDPSNRWMWVGTSRGLGLWDGDHFRVYTEADGLPDQEANSNAIATAPDGRLWLGTARGYAIFDPSSALEPPPLDTVITQVTAAGNPLSSDMVELRHSEASLRFNFLSPTFISPQVVVYQYRLKGYSDDWEQLAERTIRYVSLSPGEYQFEVRACRLGDCDPSPATWPTLTIRPPIYQTRGAIALYLLLGVLLADGLASWRSRRLHARAEQLEKTVTERTAELASEKEKSEQLLLNILPAPIVDELKARGEAPPRQHHDVTILFTDLQGFTKTASEVTPEVLVEQLNEIFDAFDQIARTHHLEKLKTIGDAYMAVAGLPVANPNHALDAVAAGLEMQAYMSSRKGLPGRFPFNLRVGIHSGTVVAGVIGRWKLAYDIWGDSVNTAARMESGGAPGEVNISLETWQRVKHRYSAESRGKHYAKGKGELEMFFVRAPLAPDKN